MKKNSTINLTAPRSYAEIAEKQLRYIAQLQVARTAEQAIWTKCLVKFTGLKPILQNAEKYYFVKKGFKGFFSISIEELNYFAKQLKYITQHYVGITPLARMGKYVACAPMLEDVPFCQYLEAESYFQAYLSDNNENSLHLFIATLYGRKGKPYDNNNTDRRARYIARRSEAEKLTVVMWMLGIKEFFAQTYTELFVSAKTNNGEQSPDMYSIIQNQVRLLTEGDITKREQVLSALTWDALHEMNAKIAENKKANK